MYLTDKQIKEKLLSGELIIDGITVENCEET